MREETIRAVMKILTDWNPLGPEAERVTDLNGYRTEAIDILFATSVYAGRKTVTEVVRQVLNQAFDLSLTMDECRNPAQKISKLADTDL